MELFFELLFYCLAVEEALFWQQVHDVLLILLVWATHEEPILEADEPAARVPFSSLGEAGALPFVLLQCCSRPIDLKLLFRLLLYKPVTNY
jgi:hypothetical protein